MKCRVPVYGIAHLHSGLNISSDWQTVGVQLFAEVMFEGFVFCTPQ